MGYGISDTTVENILKAFFGLAFRFVVFAVFFAMWIPFVAGSGVRPGDAVPQDR